MFSEEQILYLEEVLGVQSIGLAPAQESPIHEVLVLTAPLSAEGQELLGKILSSVKLKNYHLAEVENISLAELPAGLQARHVITFANYPCGKNVFDDSVWWVLPPVASMLGGNAEVVALKKEAWNVLQQFARENS